MTSLLSTVCSSPIVWSVLRHGSPSLNLTGACSGLFAQPELGADHFQRDLTLHRIVEAGVNGAHSTFAEYIDNPDVPDFLAQEFHCLRFHCQTSIAEAKAAGKLLNGFKGIAMTNGYGAYQAPARTGKQFKLVHCWAHVRRKFLEAEDGCPNFSQQFVNLIGKLFEVERKIPTTDHQKKVPDTWF